MDDLYLVFDYETYGILCTTRTATVANSVSLGFINSCADMLPTSIARRARHLKDVDLEQDILKISKGQLVPLEQHLQTTAFLEQRRIAGMRARFIYGLEAHLRRFTVRSCLQFDPESSVFFMDQLRRSDPMTHDYALGIQEYATLHDIDPSVAYQEIALIMDTNGLIKMRAAALYGKYVQRFNQCTSEDQCQAVFDQAIDDILYKAQI